MPDYSQLTRRSEAERLTRQIEYTRDICRLSVQLLRASSVDTFLGRKTQEPFPKEQE